MHLSKCQKRKLLRHGKISECLKGKEPSEDLARQLGKDLFQAFQEAYMKDFLQIARSRNWEIGEVKKLIYRNPYYRHPGRYNKRSKQLPVEI